MLKRTGLASIAAALVRPAGAENPLNTNHRFIVEVRTDEDADGVIDETVIGASVNLQWVGPAGSSILASGTTTASDPFGVANCVTIATPTQPDGGVCTVDVETPFDVGTGTLTGQGQALGMAEFDGRWDVAPTDVRIDGGGWTSEPAAVDGYVVESAGADEVVLRNDRFELSVFRRPVTDERSPIGLTCIWLGQSDSIALAAMTAGQG